MNRKSLRGIIASLAIGQSVLGSSPSEGGTLRVPSDYPTIQAAMTSAVAGDTVLVAPGTYTNCDGGPCQASVVDLKANVNLRSEGGRDVTEIRVDTPASNSSAILRGFGAHNAVIDGFSFESTADRYFGVGILSSANVQVLNCNFTDIDPNYPECTSGGALIVNGGSNRIENCRFLRCRPCGGSAILALSTTSTIIENCTFEDCVGSAILFSGTLTSTFALRNSVFLGNTSTASGAALVLTDVANGVVEDNIFVGNRGHSSGGAVYVGNSESTVHLRRNVFVDNSTGPGGGALAWAASGSISNNTFVGNFIDGSGSRYGSAIVHNAQPTESTLLSNNIFVGNYGDVAVESVLISTINSCNLFWDNPDGNYTNYTPSPTDLFADPEFCNAAAEDFTLRSSSSCLPGGTPTCGLIGAFGEGCGTVSIESTSWGKIKGLYR